MTSVRYAVGVVEVDAVFVGVQVCRVPEAGSQNKTLFQNWQAGSFG
jgi:hypothetical protein